MDSTDTRAERAIAALVLVAAGNMMVMGGNVLLGAALLQTSTIPAFGVMLCGVMLAVVGCAMLTRLSRAR